MKKEIPLLDRIYADPLYQDICKFVGYFGTTVRDLYAKLELLGQAYGKTRAEAAHNQLLSYEGQFTATSKPLAEVRLRAETRKYCFQLLGPPPEEWDRFYRHPDGTPTERHAEKMAELERLSGKRTKPIPKPKTPRGVKPARLSAPCKRGEPEGKPKTRSRKAGTKA